ncbi:MAG: M2 family metallopeptidase [Bryobacteraceae bacterium]|nr:M2 family metallopeptidase [Bryobacteraceae bacterium]
MFSACSQRKPSVGDAERFLAEAESRLLDLATQEARISWVQSTYITHDTELLAAAARERTIAATMDFAKQATRFDGVDLPPEPARKMELLKRALTMPAPSDKAESEELSLISTRMEGVYGRGKYCPGGDSSNCLDVGAITRTMAESRDPNRLLDVWKGWRTISPPMRQDYQRYVELANKGARELGMPDTGALWRSKYDMPPDDFAREVERLWEQVKPLYVSLHAYVRSRLSQKYGAAVVPPDGPIPAHLLGNIWAQSWENVSPLVSPPGADPAFDLTKILKEKNIDALGMVRYGERFFTSLGFEPLPPTFWDRSLFLKPRDREVVCHASAWDVDSAGDLRIKMCIDITGEDFTTIHHELGHNFYQRAYNRQPILFRDSANDGFHEAVGDTIALSVTPEYLVRVGLLRTAPDASKDIGLLLNRALEKVAFLPFGLLVDQWRWKVFSGEIAPANYNQAWWELRRKYQGVEAPAPRSEADFDPGAKYHVPSGVPYTRYFLAHILQFQFHRALAKAAGCADPLHRCSIFESKEAGQKLISMLEMGQSRPWPEALEALTGSRQMDATAILDYFAPLKKWLDEQNQGKATGW